MKKLIATFTLVSFLSTSLFANETLNRIIADAQDGADSAKVQEEMTLAIQQGEITKSDLDLYLKENVSPKKYKEIQEAINSGDVSELEMAISKPDGAHFDFMNFDRNPIGSIAVLIGGTILVLALANSGNNSNDQCYRNPCCPR